MWLALGMLAAFLLAAIRPTGIWRGGPVNYWINIFLPVVVVWAGAFLEIGLFRSYPRWGSVPSFIFTGVLVLGALLLVIGGIVHVRHGRK